MNRLVLVPCIVVASYVAFASYVASYVLHEFTRSRVELNSPTVIANLEEIHKDSNSPTKQTKSVHPSYEVTNNPVAIAERPAHSVLPTPSRESTWVMVLLPARVHTGPSVDTPTIHFYAVGTPLRAVRYRNDWFEITEPSTSKSGWIYRKYLGAISNSEQGKIASQEAQGQRPVVKESVPAKRYAKSAKHYAKAIPAERYTKKKFQISVTPRPFRPSVTRAPSAFRNTQPVSSRLRRTGAATKWQACCSEHSAATEEIASAYGALRTFHEENRHCNSNEQGGGFTTAIRTRGGPCATSNAKPGGGRRIHAVRKRSGRFQLVSSPWLNSVDR